MTGNPFLIAENTTVGTPCMGDKNGNNEWSTVHRLFARSLSRKKPRPMGVARVLRLLRVMTWLRHSVQSRLQPLVDRFAVNVPPANVVFWH